MFSAKGGSLSLDYIEMLLLTEGQSLQLTLLDSKFTSVCTWFRNAKYELDTGCLTLGSSCLLILVFRLRPKSSRPACDTD